MGEGKEQKKRGIKRISKKRELKRERTLMLRAKNQVRRIRKLQRKGIVRKPRAKKRRQRQKAQKEKKRRRQNKLRNRNKKQSGARQGPAGGDWGSCGTSGVNDTCLLNAVNSLNFEKNQIQ